MKRIEELILKNSGRGMDVLRSYIPEDFCSNLFCTGDIAIFRKICDHDNFRIKKPVFQSFDGFYSIVFHYCSYVHQDQIHGMIHTSLLCIGYAVQ